MKTIEQTQIHSLLQEYKEGMGHFAKHLPQISSTYHHFTEACFADGTLSKKIKHLIGLSLATHTSDEYCIVYHTKGALDQGASEQEILEATAVTSAFSGGMAMSQAVTLVQQAVHTFTNQEQPLQ